MASGVFEDPLVSFREVARRLPPLREGKPVNVSTVHRWCTRGLRGVRLEYVQVGGTKCTSEARLSRFFSRLGGSQTAPDQPEEKPSRQAELAKVESKLDALGL